MAATKRNTDRLDEVLDPAIGFEHDVFFSRQQGCDVYAYLRTHGHRVRTVHLKQISERGGNVDLPDGIIDMAQVIRSAPYATDYILEQSSFPVSILDSVGKNAEYLKALQESDTPAVMRQACMIIRSGRTKRGCCFCRKNHDRSGQNPLNEYHKKWYYLLCN